MNIYIVGQDPSEVDILASYVGLGGIVVRKVYDIRALLNLLLTSTRPDWVVFYNDSPVPKNGDTKLWEQVSGDTSDEFRRQTMVAITKWLAEKEVKVLYIYNSNNQRVGSARMENVGAYVLPDLSRMDELHKRIRSVIRV